MKLKGLLLPILILLTAFAHSESFLSKSNCVDGWIYDDLTGVAIEGVNVIYIDVSENEVVVNTVTTSPDGHYNICPKEPGVKQVFIWAPGFSTRRQDIKIFGRQPNLNFRLQRAATVQGTLLDASNQPISGAQLRVEYLQKDKFPLLVSSHSAVFKSGKDGLFRLRNIDAFRPVRLTVAHPDYDDYVVSPITFEPDQEIILKPMMIHKAREKTKE